VLLNRKKATIKAYLSKHGATVETVIMDMSYSFRAAVEEALDKPVIVADRFHFVRCVNKSMEKVRIRVQEERNDYDRKKVKKKRFVFLKGSKKMTDKDRWYLQRYFTFS